MRPTALSCELSLLLSTLGAPLSHSEHSSYDSLLVAIDRQSGELPNAIRDALESRPLATCSTPFGPPSAAARSEVQSGMLKLGEGVNVALADKEKELALAASDRFALSEKDAIVLLRSRRLDQGGASNEIGSEEDISSEMFWDAFATFLLNERHQAVALVTQMMLLGARALPCSYKSLSRHVKPMQMMTWRQHRPLSSAADGYSESIRQPLPRPA